MKNIFTGFAFIVCFLIPALLTAQPVTNQFTNYVQGGINSLEFTTNNFKAINVGKGGVIWAGSQYGGLYMYSDSFNIWRKSTKLTDVFINDIKADADSGIWVAQSGQATVGINTNIAGGLNYFRVGSDISMEFYSVTGTATNAHLLSRNVKALFIDQSKTEVNGDMPRVWVGQGTYRTSGNTRRGGLSIGLNKFAPYFNSVPEGFPSATSATPIVEAIGGNSREVWLGTRQNGTPGSKIVRYTPDGKYIGDYSHLNVTQLANGFTAQAIYFDKFGNRWVGLKQGGLKIRKPDTTWVTMDAISFFTPATQVNFNAITEDEFGNVYIGTSDGMLEYESQQYNPLSSPDYVPSYKLFTTSDGLPSNNVTGLAYDKKNGRLLITTDGGVSFMNRREPYIKGVVFDVYTRIDSANNPYPGLQKIPLTSGVTVTLLKNGVEEETTTPNAFGIFELKEANDIDNYTVEVKFVKAGKTITYIYNNVRNHTLMEPTLIPDSLIGEIKTFESKLEKRCFPIKLSFEQEFNSDLFCVDGFYLTGRELPIAQFYVAGGITEDHQKIVENLANYYTALATVYKLGGDATSLDIDGVANLLDAVEALGAFADFFIQLKKPGNADPLEQIGEDAAALGIGLIKAFKGTVIFGLSKASSFIKDPPTKAKYEKCISITGEVADLLIEVLDKGKGAGVVKFLVDNLKKVVAHTIGIQGYSDSYARDLHSGFVFDRAIAAINLESPFTYEETYDNLFNPAANSIAKYSNDTTTNKKASIAAAADIAKIADIASDAADAGSLLSAVPGGQVAGAICKALSIAAKGTKVASLFYAMYQGFTGNTEVVKMSETIAPKSGLTRLGGTSGSNPTARSQGDADSLVIRKNDYNQALTELQVVYAAPYNQANFKTKYRQFRVADSLYSLELDKTLNRMWSSADSANAVIPGFTNRLHTVIDSFVSRQGTLRQSMTLENIGYISTPNKSTFTAGLDSLCIELKVVTDSAVNGIEKLVLEISNNNIPSTAFLVQEAYSNNHSRVPGTSGTLTYTFVNRGSIAQNNVSFKINQPTGGYTITSADSINVGTVLPGQPVQVNYNYTAPLEDSIGHFVIDVKAANGDYKDVYGAFYVIDPSKIYSVKDGNWNDPATWSTNTVPTALNPVYIYHEVTVTEDATCKTATLSSPGIVTVNTGKKINILY